MEDKNKWPWEPYFPKYVYLYEISQDTGLDKCKKLVKECIETNALYPLNEIMDWWDFPEGDCIGEMKRRMAMDGIPWDDDWNDEIVERLRDEDKSDPVADLLRNSSDIHCYYDLGVEVIEPIGQTKDEHMEAMTEICQALGIGTTAPEFAKIKEVYFNACYGGHLRIYFPMPLEKLLSGEGFDVDKKDFQQIRFNGKFRVAIIDTAGGSGDFVDDVPLNITYKFDRDLLGTEEFDHYGFEGIFGDDCGIRNCGSPELIEEPEEGTEAVELDSDSLTAEREQQRKYQETFDNGGCTFGDTDMYRHRDLEYIDNFPCGWKCPHCGMFWID